MNIRVAALWRYPVKGLRGQPVPAIEVERCGFAGDRRWMVVDPDGRFISQRELPVMATISAELVEDGLVLRTQSDVGMFVAQPSAIDSESISVTVWRSTVTAIRAHRVATDWLQTVLGRSCQLVYLANEDARPVDPEYGQPDDRVSFADGFPVLLTSMGSLADLNRHLAIPVPMNRFRPNLVIEHAGAWVEDGWRRVRVGDVAFRLPKSCSRCVVTSVDQQSGERPNPHEPLHTLGTFRRSSGGVMFGQNMIPESFARIAVGDVVTARIAVGDVVTVLETGTPNVPPGEIVV
ncbi:MOSC domain-containing protein [Rhodopila sp.]|uniref:MOSC domain-containing protein n=1 Tax=Rhodopila sp. TaxID=2480087 RepID=UPI003D0B42C8